MKGIPNIATDHAVNCASLEDGTPLRIGCIGLGRRGRKHLSVLQSCPHTEVVGGLDAGDLSDLEGSVPIMRTLEELLDVRPDAVVVCVPHDQYVPIIEQCALRGIHILAEKPIARNLAEMERIASIVAGSSITLAMAVQRRQTHFYQMLEREIRLFGPPSSFSYHYALGLQQVATSWRSSSEAAGGGATIDLGYHVLDIVSGLLGSPEGLSCLQHHEAAGGALEHGASILMQFGGTTTGTVSFDWYQTHEIERADFWWRDHGVSLQDGAVFRSTRGSMISAAPKEDSLQILHRQLHEFILELRTGRSRCCLVQEALDTHRLVERCSVHARAARLAQPLPTAALVSRSLASVSGPEAA